MRRTARRLIVGLVGAAAIAAAGSAYLASNSVEPSGAGEGHGTVTITTTSSSGQPIVHATPFPVT
jgi:ABC-type glycerol-3-phosphate transport system substrate-binding protein